ncbi:MAG: glycosyltransferase family 4 protein, partial [Patescibacteria group bacterium]
TNRPDIIICGKALVEGRIALLLKKKFGIPFTICTYGMEIATWSRTARVKKQLEKVIHHADAVLHINNKTKQELLALGAPEEKLHVLYPGIDAEKLSVMNNPDDVLKKYGITPPYIICVARLVKRKGIDDLIQAFAKITVIPAPEPESRQSTAWIPGQARDDKLSLVIIGDGPERKTLEKLAKKINANVVFLGKISDEDIRALYSKATLFALTPKELPGDYEGFGIVYLEAGFFGLPVVGTKTGGVAQAIEDGTTGLLAEPGNTLSIQNTLQKMLSEPTLATQYGKAGKERVMHEFTWDTIINRLDIIIQNILI